MPLETFTRKNGARWHVAATHPRKELLALQNLHNQGFTAFFPRLKRARRSGNRIESRLEGLFPGYVFVRFDKARDRWQSINGTFGVRTLVGVREREPSAVPPEIMDTILERCRDGVWHEDSEVLVPGQAVALIDGPFVGANARFAQMLSGERVRVMLSWLATERAVVMPSSYVMAVKN